MHPEQLLGKTTKNSRACGAAALQLTCGSLWIVFHEFNASRRILALASLSQCHSCGCVGGVF